MEREIVRLPISTRDGTFIASYSAKGLVSLDFPSRNREPTARSNVPPKMQRWHRVTGKALGRALAGQSPQKVPPLDWSDGTDFQRRVWTVMRLISCGKTLSYGEIARAIGNPKAVRAVGSACGANPIPILVPCHRVLAAKGKVGGFSGGLNWKRTLLAREGVKVRS